MGRFSEQLGEQGRALQEVGVALLRTREIYRGCPRRLSVANANQLVETGVRAAMLRGPAGIPFYTEVQSTPASGV